MLSGFRVANCFLANFGEKQAVSGGVFLSLIFQIEDLKFFASQR
jgi:predicted nucleic-acid-binding Zn-ribbon protein